MICYAYVIASNPKSGLLRPWVPEPSPMGRENAICKKDYYGHDQ